MTEVIFKNTRFDPDITVFHGHAKILAKAFGYTADLDTKQDLAQLLRLRVAQLNECSYCTILHSQTARDIGIHPSKVDNLMSYWESELYTEEEKTVLKYCDALTRSDQTNFQEVHNTVAKLFTEKQVAEIAAIIINMNLWTRLKLARGATPVWLEKD